MSNLIPGLVLTGALDGPDTPGRPSGYDGPAVTSFHSAGVCVSGARQ